MSAIDDLGKACARAGVRPVFGLRAQGHMPTVIAGLAAGASWKAIGDVIGWAADAVPVWLSYDLEHVVPPSEARARAIRAVVAAQWIVAVTLVESHGNDYADGFRDLVPFSHSGYSLPDVNVARFSRLPTAEQIVDAGV